MNQIDEVKAVVDDINRMLERNSSVTGWFIYVQDIERTNVKRKKIHRPELLLREEYSYQSGVELLLEREDMWTEKYVFGISSLRNLKEIIEKPAMRFKIKSRIQKINIDRTPKTSIKGDGYFIDPIGVEEMLERISVHQDSMREIFFDDRVSSEIECIAIANHFDELNISTMRRYTATISGSIKHGNQYSIHRLIGARNLNSFVENYEITKSDMIQQLVYLRNSTLLNLMEKLDILLSPEIIGEIIRVLATYFSPEDLKEIFPNELSIIDNPTRSGGYFSTVIDDRGALTTSTNLLESKELNWYKYKSFELFLRSYNFKIRRHISNVILTGGIGSGESFTERRKSFVKVTTAESSVIGQGSELKVIININEADLWKNGILSNPMRGFTIIVNLKELFASGTYSNDHILSFSSQKAGASYTGWIWLPSTSYKLY